MLEALLKRAPSVPWTMDALEGRRRAIAAAHARGASGVETVTALTALADDILRDLYALEYAGTFSPAGVVLVALGGYGRRELAPYSDIDLMFLYEPLHEREARAVSAAILHVLWDLGFQVGHSVRTMADCRSMGRTDFTIRTALMEARWLAGDQALFDEFTRTYREQVSEKRVQDYVAHKLVERQEEYGKYGSTNFLLEPNIKKSRGGLRDLHLLKWTALARYETSSFEDLSAVGLLSAGDVAALWDAQEFFWRVRNELHFFALRAQDIVTFDEQIRIASLWGFKDLPHLLAVEQFMQQYYRHSTRVCDITSRFVSQAMHRSVWQRLAAWLPARRLERYFELTKDEITVPPDFRDEAFSEGSRILRLFQLSQTYGLSIADDLVQDLPERVAPLADKDFRSESSRRSFLAILAGPGRVSATLAAMHQVSLLERFIPAFGTVRGLMQFNAYHKYTVDQHNLLAVSQAEQIGTTNGLLGRVYREITRKDLLHLALLIHDIGKGQEEDHSVIGERIAVDVAGRLGLDDHETQLLVFLVRYHLLMSNTAFRRDSSDEKVVLRFARQVGKPEALKMLFVLTAADVAAVGPGVFTRWKETLLGELFIKTHKELAGGEEAETTYEDLLVQAQEVRHVVLERLGHRLPQEWLRKQLEAWPDHYLSAMPVERILTHLEWLAKLTGRSVLVDAQHDPILGTTDYTVYTQEQIIPGIFSKIAGVLAAKGLQILDAQILTLADDMVVDVFRVQDPDCPEGPPPHRIHDVSQSIGAVLEGQRSVEALLREANRFGQSRQGVPLREPTVVQVDNDSSVRYTIIDVFADDRQGLLYVITRAIFDLSLSVHAARIATRLDQVVDVFYVTDQGAGKIDDPGRCKLISETITGRIEEYLGQTQTTRPVVHRAAVQRKSFGIQS
ncbi:MAG: [protein-PII] uridylyltransferase [Nitrospirae bacterium]|nr:MAG: [protein-PII] uridylyltransferase [Nitrospirota bacterium]